MYSNAPPPPSSAPSHASNASQLPPGPGNGSAAQAGAVPSAATGSWLLPASKIKKKKVSTGVVVSFDPSAPGVYQIGSGQKPQTGGEVPEPSRVTLEAPVARPQPGVAPPPPPPGAIPGHYSIGRHGPGSQPYHDPYYQPYMSQQGPPSMHRSYSNPSISSLSPYPAAPYPQSSIPPQHYMMHAPSPAQGWSQNGAPQAFYGGPNGMPPPPQGWHPYGPIPGQWGPVMPQQPVMPQKLFFAEFNGQRFPGYYDNYDRYHYFGSAEEADIATQRAKEVTAVPSQPVAQAAAPISTSFPPPNFMSGQVPPPPNFPPPPSVTAIPPPSVSQAHPSMMNVPPPPPINTVPSPQPPVAQPSEAPAAATHVKNMRYKELCESMPPKPRKTEKSKGDRGGAVGSENESKPNGTGASSSSSPPSVPSPTKESGDRDIAGSVVSQVSNIKNLTYKELCKIIPPKPPKSVKTPRSATLAAPPSSPLTGEASPASPKRPNLLQSFFGDATSPGSSPGVRGKAFGGEGRSVSSPGFATGYFGVKPPTPPASSLSPPPSATSSGSAKAPSFLLGPLPFEEGDKEGASPSSGMQTTGDQTNSMVESDAALAASLAADPSKKDANVDSDYAFALAIFASQIQSNVTATTVHQTGASSISSPTRVVLSPTSSPKPPASQSNQIGSTSSALPVGRFMGIDDVGVAGASIPGTVPLLSSDETTAPPPPPTQIQNLGGSPIDEIGVPSHVNPSAAITRTPPLPPTSIDSFSEPTSTMTAQSPTPTHNVEAPPSSSSPSPLAATSTPPSSTDGNEQIRRATLVETLLDKGFELDGVLYALESVGYDLGLAVAILMEDREAHERALIDAGSEGEVAGPTGSAVVEAVHGQQEAEKVEAVDVEVMEVEQEVGKVEAVDVEVIEVIEVKQTIEVQEVQRTVEEMQEAQVEAEKSEEPEDLQTVPKIEKVQDVKQAEEVQELIEAEKIVEVREMKVVQEFREIEKEQDEEVPEADTVHEVQEAVSVPLSPPVAIPTDSFEIPESTPCVKEPTLTEAAKAPSLDELEIPIYSLGLVTEPIFDESMSPPPPPPSAVTSAALQDRVETEDVVFAAPSPIPPPRTTSSPHPATWGIYGSIASVSSFAKPEPPPRIMRAEPVPPPDADNVVDSDVTANVFGSLPSPPVSDEEASVTQIKTFVPPPPPPGPPPLKNDAPPPPPPNAIAHADMRASIAIPTSSTPEPLPKGEVSLIDQVKEFRRRSALYLPVDEESDALKKPSSRSSYIVPSRNSSLDMMDGSVAPSGLGRGGYLGESLIRTDQSDRMRGTSSSPLGMATSVSWDGMSVAPPPPNKTLPTHFIGATGHISSSPLPMPPRSSTMSPPLPPAPVSASLSTSPPLPLPPPAVFENASLEKDLPLPPPVPPKEEDEDLPPPPPPPRVQYFAAPLVNGSGVVGQMGGR
ncbi:hypothetical protein HDU67_004269 [Dinochytrium kinnereticum]|nr:hypothetical protein HDU67_004269 [Dinochytrium kinnereticum]